MKRETGSQRNKRSFDCFYLVRYRFQVRASVHTFEKFRGVLTENFRTSSFSRRTLLLQVNFYFDVCEGGRLAYSGHEYLLSVRRGFE